MKCSISTRWGDFRKNICQEGLVWCWQHYWTRVFSKITFGRWDISVYPDARLRGVQYMQIGERFVAGRGLWLEAVMEYPLTGQDFVPQLIIGERVNVGEYVHIGCNHRIVIGDDVLMGSKIYITDHNHGVYRGDNADSPAVPPVDRRLTEGESVEIGARCWIGEFVTILPGVTIGEGSIIGSQSTVTHDIPANSIAVGSPARVVKQWDVVSKQWNRV
ncbi:MAG: acyltransferase [Butyrivibrio sp.]|nr:acyltransferase [Butyrivibrio sp.]